MFDGYRHLSTKDHKHKRRERSHPPCPDVQVKKDTQLQHSQSLFLTKNSNKTQLINLLSVALKEAGHIVKTSHDDADTFIVSTALDFAIEKMPLLVIAAHTNVLIMLLYYWNNEMVNILMLSDSVQRKEKSLKVYNIKEIAEKLNHKILKYLLVIHAFTSCNTTSSIYDKGKNCILKLVTKSAKVQSLCDVFIDSHSTQENVGKAGIDIFKVLYGSKGKFYHISSSKYLQHKMII